MRTWPLALEGGGLGQAAVTTPRMVPHLKQLCASTQAANTQLLSCSGTVWQSYRLPVSQKPPGSLGNFLGQPSALLMVRTPTLS